MIPTPEQVVPLLRQRPIRLERRPAPCGFCGHDRDDHGTRYSTFGGSHEWVRRHPGSHATALHPIGDEP